MRFFTSLLTLTLATLTLLPASATARHALAATAAGAPSIVAQAAPAPTLSVYPNPGRGQVSVQLAAVTGFEYKFRLNNVLGREVRLLALRPELSAEATSLDVSNLPAGLYFYSLLVNDHVVSTNRLTLQ